MNNETADNTMLEHWVAVGPYLQELVSFDCAVSIVDLEQCRYYHDGKQIKFPIKIGDKLNPKSQVGQAITKNERMIAEVGEQLFGFPYLAIAIPIRNGRGQAIGAITLCELTDRKKNLLRIAEKLDKAINEWSDSMHTIAGQAEQLSEASQQLHCITDNTVQQMKRTDDVLGFIRQVADQTNLLGLNAAIEAARVGSLGAGFAVVANEVRKLSSDSNQSVNKINDVLQSMQAEIKNIQQAVNSMSAASQNQSAAIQEMTASLDQLSAMSAELRDMATRLGLA